VSNVEIVAPTTIAVEPKFLLKRKIFTNFVIKRK
jgi:hypothetical protein